jgi:RHS repeat-associated protein
MAGISSSAAGSLQNKFMFNAGTELKNNEFTDRSGLEWYATDFRSYDPQIGRFIQQDALAEIYEHLTSYSFANNNPILLNDSFGLSSDTIPHLPIVWVTAPQTPAFPPATPIPIQPVPSDNSEARNVPTVPVGPVKLPQPTLPEPPTAKPSGGAGAGTATKVLGTIGLLLSPISTGDGLDNAMYSSEIIKKFSYEGHGNKLYNWNTHIVDVFFFKPSDNRTPVIKYGISDETRYSLERPERQKPYYKSRFGGTADYRILTRMLTRAGALAIERNLVELHLKIWGTMPRDQLRPTIN